MQQSKQEDLDIQYSDNESLKQDQPPIESDGEEENANQVEGYNQTQSGPLELIYIMFSFYRKDLKELVEKYDCKIKFSLSCYIIQQPTRSDKEKFVQCLRETSNFMKSINVEEMKIPSDPKEKIKFVRSSHIRSLLQKKNIRLIYFHKTVYIFSREKSRQLIKNEIQQIVKNTQIYSICFRRIRKQIGYYNDIFQHVSEYLKLIFQHLKSFFQERQLIVQIQQSKKFLYIHGKKSKYILEAKYTMMNILQSLVCLFIKDTTINGKTMANYLKKSVVYPIHFAKYYHNIYVIISKDNIFKQLILKSPNFLKYLGVQAQNEQSPAIQPTIGFYMIHSNSYPLKFQKIRELLQKKSHDIYTHLGIKYLKKVFFQQGKDSNNYIRQILIDIFKAIEEFKIKYEVIRYNKPQEQKIQENNDGLKYKIVGGKQSDTQLSKLLKRDILSQKLQMKKQFIIKFNVVQTRQQSTIWILRKTGEEGQQIKAEDLKEGTYLSGLKKINFNGEEVRLYQYLLTVL